MLCWVGEGEEEGKKGEGGREEGGGGGCNGRCLLMVMVCGTGNVREFWYRIHSCFVT